MKKILITGAAGFMGSHLTERMIGLGYEVRTFVRYNSRNLWGWLETSSVKNDVEVISGDIRDYEAVLKAMHDCQAVFHLAALIGIPYSYVSPAAYIRTNIDGTYNVLHAAKTLGVENVIITSTSEVYGTAQSVPIDESHPVVGQSPYSATKIAADQLATSYYLSFKLPVKIVRPFNTYGPRQSARAIIPTIISQLLNGQKQIKLGNLLPTRDLTFVKDTVDAFIDIFRSDKLLGEVTNVGMNEEISIGDLAAKIMNVMNVKAEIVTDRQRIRPGQSEVERLRCNNQKLLMATAWRPKQDLRAGLLETIEWIQRNTAMYKPGIYNL